MLILVPASKWERFQVMVWAAGNGPQTPAVRRFVLAQKLTFAAGLITREMGTLECAVFN